MSIFKYKIINAEGKEQKGLIDSSSEKTAVEFLEEKGFSIISIEKQGKISNLNLDILNRVTAKDLVIFSRQFSVMISANVALVQALKILIDQTENPKLKSIISEVASEVDSGSRLSEALGKRNDVFSDFFINVIKSGETSGKLDEVLNYLADEMEQDYDMNKKIKGAMIYPVFILGGLVVVGVLMMIFVVPKLTAIIVESGAEMPMPTKILIAISGFLTSYWWTLILGVLAIFGLYKYVSKTEKGKYTIDYIKLRIPIFGNLFQLIHVVRFSRSMNTLVVGGVTIAKALEVSADVVGNRVYQELIKTTLKEVEDGNSISSVFINSEEIPKMVSQMMSVGEKTGKLDTVLEKVTNFYSREINNIVANLMTLLEPVVMVIMGIAVALMVAAIILPMYNVASGF